VLPVAGFGKGTFLKRLNSVLGIGSPGATFVAYDPRVPGRECRLNKVLMHVDVPCMTREPWFRGHEGINNKWPKSCQWCEFCPKNVRGLVCSSEPAAISAVLRVAF